MTPAHQRGLLDTSVVVDLASLTESDLPAEPAICTITLAELSAGPLAARSPAERARRLAVLQRTEVTFDPLPFDRASAQSYAQIYAAVRSFGRQPRTRVADLLIAAVAQAHQLPLYTRNSDDFSGLESLMTIVPLKTPDLNNPHALGVGTDITDSEVMRQARR